MYKMISKIKTVYVFENAASERKEMHNFQLL